MYSGEKQHRAVLQDIARRAMLGLGLQLSFSTAAEISPMLLDEPSANLTFLKLSEGRLSVASNVIHMLLRPLPRVGQNVQGRVRKPGRRTGRSCQVKRRPRG